MGNKYLRLGLLLLLLAGGEIHAQQLPQSSLFSLNPFLVNPALSGAYDYTDVRLSYRRQWLGLDDAPSTASLTAHLPVGYSDKPIHGIRSPRYARNRSATQSPPEGTWRWGAGVQFLSDQTGFTLRNVALVTGAAHVSLPNQWQLSAGLGAGMLQYTLRFDRIQTANPSDPILPAGNASLVRPMLSAGLMLRRQNFLAAASVLAPNAPRLEFETTTGTTINRIEPHYYLTTSYRLEVGDELAVLPQVWVKAVGNAPLSFDTQLRVQYADRLWAGLLYRLHESLGAQLGLALTDLLSVSYAYEYPLSRVRLATTGSHELMLAFRFNNRAFIYNPPLGW